jgi:hypothetical protein
MRTRRIGPSVLAVAIVLGAAGAAFAAGTVVPGPHPMMPWSGVPTTSGLGVPIRQIWMPPKSVPIEVFVPKSETEPERWDTQYTEVPGYYYTETTLGYIYPDRWALYSPERGRYEWQRVPSAFTPK